MSEMRIGRLEQHEINKSISLHTIHFYGDERPEAEENRRKKWVNIVLSIMTHCNCWVLQKGTSYMQWIVISFQGKLTPKSGRELNQW